MRGRPPGWEEEPMFEGRTEKLREIKKGSWLKVG